MTVTMTVTVTTIVIMTVAMNKRMNRPLRTATKTPNPPPQMALRLWPHRAKACITSAALVPSAVLSLPCCLRPSTGQHKPARGCLSRAAPSFGAPCPLTL